MKAKDRNIYGPYPFAPRQDHPGRVAFTLMPRRDAGRGYERCLGMNGTVYMRQVSVGVMIPNPPGCTGIRKG